jgi:hypothetical protein
MVYGFGKCLWILFSGRGDRDDIEAAAEYSIGGVMVALVLFAIIWVLEP